MEHIEVYSTLNVQQTNMIAELKILSYCLQVQYIFNEIISTINHLQFL